MASSIFLVTLLLVTIFGVTNVAYAQDGGMRGTTSKGTLDVMIEPIWGENGSARFNVSFFSPGTDTLHEHQDYDFRILKDGTEVFSAAKQTNQQLIHNVEGTITVPYTFEENGDYTIQIFLAATGIAPPIPTEEDVIFPVTIVPEFPMGAIGAVVAAIMAGTVVFARRMFRR